MVYYGIVDELKPEHQSGLYGNKRLSKQEIKAIAKQDVLKDIFELIVPVTVLAPIVALPIAIYKIVQRRQKLQTSISLQQAIGGCCKMLVFNNSSLNGNYDIESNKTLFYGLFDKYAFPNNVFKKIMASGGGSTLIIQERATVPAERHLGGAVGKFNTGLYMSHPKDDNILIPLDNSQDIIQNLVLEETIRAFEALGAKSIVISDLTTVGLNTSGGNKTGKGEIEVKRDKIILRQKKFGAGTFDPERALRDCLFIYDYQDIMNTVNARIHGNQTEDEYTVDVNLAVGLDLEVFKVFNASASFNFQRRWRFKVEFYDKNTM